MADRQGVIYQPEQLTAQVPADIPLDQAVEMIKAIADKQRAGLIAASVMSYEDMSEWANAN